MRWQEDNQITNRNALWEEVKKLKEFQEAPRYSRFVRRAKTLAAEISPELFDEIEDIDSGVSTAAARSFRIAVGSLAGIQEKIDAKRLGVAAVDTNELPTLNQVISDIGHTYRLIAPYLTSFQLRRDRSQELIDSAARLKNELDDLTSRKDAIRNVATEEAGKKAQKDFGGLSRSYARQALFWLLATAFVALLFGKFIWRNWGIDPQIKIELTGKIVSLQVGYLISYFGPRLLATLLFVSGIVFCARNYSANRHNQVVCEHRQRAFEVFEIWWATLPSESKRSDTILAKAAEAVFGFQQTGFSNGNAEINFSPLVEIISERMKGQ